MKDFFAGKKKLFKISEVRFLAKIYSFKELTISAVLENYPRREEARKCLPDGIDEKKLDKTYVLTFVHQILNTVLPGYIEHITKKALNDRKQGDTGLQNSIEVQSDLAYLFNSQLFQMRPSRIWNRMRPN